LSEFAPFSGDAWRLIEAQHRVSTMKLVDDLDEQALLESVIEDTKPPLPAECRNLDYLLYTPFRYGAPYPHGSRFRRAGHTEGVWYGSERVITAVAELAFYRLLFFAESPQTPWPRGVSEFTAFAAALKTDHLVDLLQPPHDAERPALEHVADYSTCQALADTVRSEGAEVIRYRSVRDPDGRSNLAVLTCNAFAKPRPTKRQTWRMRISATGVLALGPEPRDRLGFGRDAFAKDPRIAAIAWDR
jgi:hypothetical protein